VEHAEGPLLVLAGAGSGKTRVLTARIARLIDEEGVRPGRILAVTFTNKAAGVMGERIAGLLGEEPRGLWIGTFHAIAARILRREGDRLARGSTFSIYDEEDSLRALKHAMEEAGLDAQRWSPGALRARISSAKNALVGPEEYAAAAFDLASRAVAEVYPLYEKILIRSSAYDFDDLLVHTTRLLEDTEVGDRYAGRFHHVLVDEYQDTNHAQYRMIRRLASGHGNICVVGDDDQSIYGWRGADLRNILDFERDFRGTEVVRLEQNYRSTPSILHVANEVISRNRDRKKKRLRTERPSGERVTVVQVADERAEATWVVSRIETLAGCHDPEQCVVLYRTNAQSRPFEDALRRARMPYRIVGGVRFYERREIKDVLAYLLLAVNPADEAAFTRAVSWPRRGVGGVTLDRLRMEAAALGVTLLEGAERATEFSGMPPAGARALVDFTDGINSLAQLGRNATVEEVIRECIRCFQLVAALEREDDGADRIANLTELLAAAAAFDPAEVEDGRDGASELELYLQSASLRADIDDYEESAPGVTLMTIHNAKGLEFPVVFVAGLEEGLFPLARAMDNRHQLEEERRLFYVGVTRAQERLFLTHANRRWRYGNEVLAQPSSFLSELPEGPVEYRIAAGAAGGTRRRSRWSREEVDKEGFAMESSRAGTSPSGFAWRRQSPPSDASGLRYDFSDSQEQLHLEVGARVIHPSFGEGEIVSVSGAGRSTKAEIDFGRFGCKKVMVAHARLRPVYDRPRRANPADDPSGQHGVQHRQRLGAAVGQRLFQYLAGQAGGITSRVPQRCRSPGQRKVVVRRCRQRLSGAPPAGHDHPAPDPLGFGQTLRPDRIQPRGVGLHVSDEEVPHQLKTVALVSGYLGGVEIPARVVYHRIEDGLPALVPANPNHPAKDPAVRAEAEQCAGEYPSEELVGSRVVETRYYPPSKPRVLRSDIGIHAVFPVGMSQCPRR
jgi:DNA helicase-2/ATP-dependent DNA helicase PcrA